VLESFGAKILIGITDLLSPKWSKALEQKFDKNHGILGFRTLKFFLSKNARKLWSKIFDRNNRSLIPKVVESFGAKILIGIKDY